MPKKKEVAPVEVVEERRAPDADGAVEVAFVEGVLPEEDRREPEPLVIIDEATELSEEQLQAARTPVVGIDPIPSEPPLRSRADDLLFLSQRKPGA